MRARLRNLARERRVEFQLVLSEYAIERLLYRLGVSRHRDGFVLKGAKVFRLWSSETRATWDLDLLGRRALDARGVEAVFRNLCSIRANDAIVFDPASIASAEIRAAGTYAGVRIRMVAHLADARMRVQVDVGFGDVVTPAPLRETYPTLLDDPAPDILVYPPEAVVAEKLEAMVSLGVTNSRLKDFYDVYVLASSFPFEGEPLAAAIRATFQRRRTPLPSIEPLVLTPDFLAAADRATQWRAMLRRGRLEAPPDPADLSDVLLAFLSPVLAALTAGDQFRAAWSPGGPWIPERES
ncbi:MAG: nucleotidyl transferase AbiEii/AbiGii toxin family protein [Gemmatimonadetes bacterium]|nr:nucleotidyl transferase AbiEii/AbiGii toxin family protein [Gemmatimonadota bacterium]